MKLVQIKTARELKLPGTSVEFVTEGDTLKEIIFRPEGEEESFSVKYGDAYASNLKVFVRREFEIKERQRLSGTMHGVEFSKDFDNVAEADAAARQLPASATYEIKPVKVRVDEAGEPLPVPAVDDIPF